MYLKQPLRKTVHGHPYSNKQNRVFIHRLIAEQALSKYLHPKHPVHHHSETELVICENQIYHKLLHQRTDALKACGHANWRKCVYCKQYNNPKNLTIDRFNAAYHMPCALDYVKEWKERRRLTFI